MTYRKYLFLPVFLLIIACQNSTPHAETSEVSVALTPEQTVRKFQAHLDNNEFDGAISMSTPEMKNILSSLRDLFDEESDDAGITQTTFLRIKCKEEKTMATCSCNLRDEYDDYSSTFFLKKIDGKWFVDRTEDQYSDDDDEVKIFDSE